MESSPASQPAMTWNAVDANNCVWIQNPGRYLLRKNNWTDPNFYTNLFGIWDGSRGQIKLYVTDHEKFWTDDQVKKQKMATGNCEHTDRKALVQNLKQKCVAYNNLVDSVAIMTRDNQMSERAIRGYKNLILKMLENLNGVIISGYDSFALEKQGNTLEDLATTLFSSVLNLQAALSTEKLELEQEKAELQRFQEEHARQATRRFKVIRKVRLAKIGRGGGSGSKGNAKRN